ncbi:MAG: hypothetical protein L0Y72_13060 [Gemmataceae bacterium]|nr:hypothetical protein [Gemmataceae bacterium]MCI0739967.1 hypothetical protein [Gemmataceae bacterium]
MATPLTNVSFDGSPVQFRMDSPLLACFDPLALDMLHDLLPPGTRFDVAELLERANVNHPAIACYTIPDFRPGLFTLDPHDIKKFGDEEEDIDYSEGDQAEGEFAGKAPSYPFAAVDSGALIVADVGQLPKIAHLMTWELYDLGLQDDAVFVTIVEALGGPYFAVIHSGSMPGMEFDGDGTYSIPAGCVRPSRS